MSSTKQLGSVCHNIAHHATSGLSFIHPHLQQACRSVGLKSIIIDLGKEDPCPESFKTNGPLRLSLGELRKKFVEILSREGFGTDDVQGIVLQFDFSLASDDYSSICHACLVTKAGKTYRHSVDQLGATHAPNKELQPPHVGEER